MRYKKKFEFSKLLALWAIFMMTAVTSTSYVLAFLDKNPITELSNSINTLCMAYLVTYAAKSAFEKNSRNKYKVDENGVPFSIIKEGIYANDQCGRVDYS